MQRGSDRLGVHKDEERKHELQGLLRSGHSTRSEEWHDPEPSAEDDPGLATGPVAPSRPGEDFEALRHELGRHLGRTPFPAKRGDLLRLLHQRNAPDRLVGLVGELPGHGTYRTVHDVVTALHGTDR